MEAHIFGRQLQKFRKSRGWSQEQIATILNVTKQAVSKWESEKSSPSERNIATYAYLLGVPVEFFNGDDSLLNDMKKKDFELYNRYLPHPSEYPFHQKTARRQDDGHYSAKELDLSWINLYEMAFKMRSEGTISDETLREFLKSVDGKMISKKPE